MQGKIMTSQRRPRWICQLDQTGSEPTSTCHQAQCRTIRDHRVGSQKIVSEGKLQGQLYLPRRRHGFGNLTLSGAASLRLRKNILVGLAEVGVIVNVDNFCTEMDMLSV